MGKGRSKVWRNTSQQKGESWPQHGWAPCSHLPARARPWSLLSWRVKEKLNGVSVVLEGPSSCGLPMLQPTGPTAGLGLLIHREKDCCRSEGSLPRA